MYSRGRRSAQSDVNIWPGWVDALSSLIMVIIFVLMIFVVAQFYLAHTLSGRDQALVHLNQKILELSELLTSERQTNAELHTSVSQLSDQLQASLTTREALAGNLTTLTDDRDQLAQRLAAAAKRGDEAGAEAGRVSHDLEDAYKVIQADRDKIDVQLRSIASLEADLKALRAARDKMESDIAALAVVAQALQTKTGDLTAQRDAATAEGKKRGDELRLSEDQRQKLALLLQQTQEQTRGLQEQATATEAQRLKLGDELRLSEDEKKLLLSQLAALRDRSKELEAKLSDQSERTTLAQKNIDSRDIRIKELVATLDTTQTALSGEQQTTGRNSQKIAELTAEIQALREQLARLTAALDASEARSGSQKATITDLTGRLNAALANKVEELARYRSEFFGRLREVIGTRPDIRIVGDRFVFQSEVLFPTGSATLQDAGKGQLAQLAHALLDIARTIPPDVNWILRVDGHTDPRRIATYQFPSNWELSTARAISVVKFLIEQGIPSERLAATGFGEFQPLDPGDGDDAFARNRRIELKLDQR